MLVKTKGLIIRSLKYGESSLIFDLYTQDQGLASFIVGGVRKIKTKTPASIFQLMNWIEVVAYLKDPKSLSRVKEARPILHYRQLPFELKKRSVALFMTEIIQKTIREHEANRSLYNFLWDSFLFIDQTLQPVENIHLVFLIQLSQYLGFLPHGQYSEEQPYLDLLKGTFVSKQHPIYTLDRNSSQLISACTQHVLATSHHLGLDRDQRRKLIQHLLSFYRLHLEKMSEIKTHKILADVL